METTTKFAELKIRRSMTQATRYEPSVETVDYDVRVFPGGFSEWVSCKTLDEARELAARHGFALEGDAGQMKLIGLPGAR